jgi:hypothetical protein
MSNHKLKRYSPPEDILNDANVQTAIKVLGAVLMATKTKGLETDFPMVDQFGVTHQYHLDISEKNILLGNPE